MLDLCNHASQDKLVQVRSPCCVPGLLQKEESGLGAMVHGGAGMHGSPMTDAQGRK